MTTPRIILWNVDTQKDFMLNGGKLYVEGSELVLPFLQKMTDFGRDYNLTIVNQGDQHDENTPEISENPDYKHFWPKHCMRNTLGAEFVNETNPINSYIIDYTDKSVDLEKLAAAKNIVLWKNGVDIFHPVTGNPHVETVLDALQGDKFLIYGTVRSVCVDYAAVGLRTRGKDVYVVKNAVPGLPSIPAEGTLERWEHLGIHLRDTSDLPDLANHWNLEKVVSYR